MRALEQRELVPGQRLVETDLAAQYGVGRNAVREAVQWLSAHGVIDVTRYRSAAIRQLDSAETLEVLDIAEAMIGLAVRTAALGYREESHRPLLEGALVELERADEMDPGGVFSRGRRHFHRVLLEIGGSRELRRLFPALGMHILYAQYHKAGLGRRRLDDFRAMAKAVAAKDGAAAEAVARAHVSHLREAVLKSVG